MSTAARKARKKAHIPFIRIPKIGTPLEQRALREPDFGFQLRWGRTHSARHQKKIRQQMEIRDSGIVTEGSNIHYEKTTPGVSGTPVSSHNASLS